ncbi:MAG TPA: molybdate ABC transporter substrate-binding protein [Patescibacteria group bacterium]|nr:molybdate ABC transporter substrate-binding protein [Patescibacteria group bacterium]
MRWRSRRQAGRTASWLGGAGLALAIVAVPSAAAGPAPESPEIVVDAAASLRNALQAIGPACEKQAGVRLVFNFGASNDLARQILAANKADVFFSADEPLMDKVAGEGLVDAASRRSLLSNRLVVIVPLDSHLSVAGPADLAAPAVKRIALADPNAVPAGKYARAWLEKAHQWEAVQDRVVPTVDVRAALAAVEAGGVEVGVVYSTDAAISKKVRVEYQVPDGDAPLISYPVAALKGRPQQDAARRVVDCLAGAEAVKTFEAFGFIVRHP